jgi:hypothetical protein
MMALFGDESYDEHTYALGGWLATPTHYRILDTEWRRMLATLKMPDGSTCKAFHAAAIMNQLDEFQGWGKNEAFDAFDKATAVLADRPVKFTIWPCAVATTIPKGLSGRDRDGIWLALFLRFFMLVLDAMPGARSIEFVFDTKHDIEKHARAAYNKLTGPLRTVVPDSYLEGMTFVEDHGAPVLQAADLLVFEWRKSLTYRRIAPERDDRPWFPRIRATRSKGALVRYDIMKYLREYKTMTDEGQKIRRMLTGDEIGRD